MVTVGPLSPSIGLRSVNCSVILQFAEEMFYRVNLGYLGYVGSWAIQAVGEDPSRISRICRMSGHPGRW